MGGEWKWIRVLKMGNDRLHVGAVLLKPYLAWLQNDTYVH